MKHLLIALSLALASCAGVQPGNVPIAEGSVARTIERVLDRTEAYAAEDSLEFDREVAVSIEHARSVLLVPEASGASLRSYLAPLMSLHDLLVSERGADGRLEQLEVDVYLEDTARLRSLFDAVNIYAAPALAP